MVGLNRTERMVLQLREKRRKSLWFLCDQESLPETMKRIDDEQRKNERIGLLRDKNIGDDE